MMRKLFWGLAIILGAIGAGTQRLLADSGHDSKPKQGTFDQADVRARFERIRNSPYFKNLQPLGAFVPGKLVVDSVSGNAGFVLLLKDGGWVAAFRENSQIGSSFGKGKPDSKVLSKIKSTEYGDATEPTNENFPYANIRCDIAKQVRESHGKRLEGLSFGEGTFNFTFEKKHELDFFLVKDVHGKPAVRVFWEQW